jgi:Asp-tRNA(Asn)/Glu-tRNA(Gln) amidotransferase A subunit family amidase
LLTPAGRSSIYALKLTVGNFAADGIFRLTKALDSIGGMAKCSADLTILTRILLSTAPADHATQDLESVHKMQFKDFTIGFVDPEVWRLPSSLLDPTEEYKKQTVSALAQFHTTTKSTLSARGLSIGNRHCEIPWRKSCVSGGYYTRQQYHL